MVCGRVPAEKPQRIEREEGTPTPGQETATEALCERACTPPGGGKVEPVAGDCRRQPAMYPAIGRVRELTPYPIQRNARTFPFKRAWYVRAAIRHRQTPSGFSSSVLVQNPNN